MNEPKTPKISQSRPYSYFAYRPRDFSPDRNFSVKIPLTKYCKQRHISKKQAKRFVKWKWINITMHRHQIWVEEVCTEKIDDYLKIY